MVSEMVGRWWSVPAMVVVAAQSSASGLERLTELGAIGAVLAVMIWQQYAREKRLGDEVKDREDRMASRISSLEDRDHNAVQILTDHNKHLQEFIRVKLMDIVETQTANVKSCHEWRNEARVKLETITVKSKDE